MDSFNDFAETKEACEDLIGALQDLHYKIKTIEDFSEYGVVDSLIECIEEVLTRYDALD